MHLKQAIKMRKEYYDKKPLWVLDHDTGFQVSTEKFLELFDKYGSKKREDYDYPIELFKIVEDEKVFTLIDHELANKLRDEGKIK